MQEITIQEIKEKALLFQKQGKKWHFHILLPNCIFNERKDKNAFILENETDQEYFVVYSDKRYMEEGQFLVKILHGKNILEEQTKQKIEKDENVRNILKRAEELNKKKIPWHHHMFFPNCIFNKNKGRWTVVFEDPEDGDVIEFSSEDEPRNILNKIEVLYYQQKE